MQRRLTSATTLDNLRKQAKRWYKALQEKDAAAMERLRGVHPAAAGAPVLRDVQHALAVEYGFESWARLKAALVEIAQGSRGESVAIVDRFLEYACPDQHVRGGPAHRMAQHAAVRLLNDHPEIAEADFFTAVVCGELELVRHMLRDQPGLAKTQRAVAGKDRSTAGESFDFLGDMGGKAWEPLLFLCFTRLPAERVNTNAVAIARELLDHGANPNAYFMAGDSRYTPLTGVVGEGEEERPGHPRRVELARLLLEYGAEPYDAQVIYNIHFEGRILWWTKLMHEFSLRAGREADWADPEWRMLDQGGYGTGARWHLRIAVENDDSELAEWCLSHGANPNAAPERDQRFPQRSLYEHALALGHPGMAEFLARYGAERRERALSTEERYTAACLRLDRAEAERLLSDHPEFLRSPAALFAAAKQDRAEAIRLLLDLGTPIEIENERKQRALHIAAANGALAVVEALLDRGAEIDPRESNYQGTPLGFAAYRDRRRIVDVLSRVSRNVWDLVFVGAVDRLRTVLAEEPDLAKTAGKTTPLFWLPDDEGKALEIANLLLERGADPSVRGGEDKITAADLARKRGMHAVADRLERAMASGQGRPRSPEDYQRAAEDFVKAYESDAAALDRLNRHYGRTFSEADLKAEIWRRVYAFRERSWRSSKNQLKLEEAQSILAQDAGFGSWASLLSAVESGTPPQGAPYFIDGKERRISPRRRMSSADWTQLIGVSREHRIPSLDAGGFMTDEAMREVAGLEHVTSLNLGGSRELTDDGLLELARMPQLEHLNLSEYPGGKITDRGLEVLKSLPNLRSFEMTWQAGITDGGASHLRHCEQLERVDLMGSPTGDGAIEALQGKPRLRMFQTGRLVTDAGLPFLRNFPLLKTWDENLGAKLLIDGPFSDRGLEGLADLEGVIDLDLFWHVRNVTADGFASLIHWPHLLSLGADGKLSGDGAMRHIAAMPSLRRLRCQESVATDEGFEALSRSGSIEFLWGRVCPNFSGRGFLALSRMPALRGLGIGCQKVEDEALATLPRFPSLRELTPIGFLDGGFRHIGRCQSLERLTCMYCRETTDAATEFIAPLQIRYYYAGLTQITDRSLEILGGIETLEQVDLYECQSVTDAGLPFLARLPRLREVHLDSLPGVTLEGTKVFPAAVQVYHST